MSALTADETRDRLIDAAAEEFAGRGFRAASVRGICKRARANVAAVNYHFRDKKGLYSEVCKRSIRAALEKYPPTWKLPPRPTHEQRLHAFVRSFLYRVVDCANSTCHGGLMTREMSDPTGLLDEIIAEFIRPLSDALTSIVADLLGPAATKENTRLCAASIAGQCLYYKHSQPIIARLNPGMKFDARALDSLADHIARFSIHAIRACRREHAGGRP